VQTRTRNAIALAVVAAALTGGLAVLARSRRSADLRARALDAVPAGALLVATADLAALRASPVGVPFLREGREIPGVGKVRDVCGFDPMDTLTEAALAIPAAGDAGDFGLVAAGPVDDEALVGCAAKVIEARGGRPVVTPLGSFRAVRDVSIAGGGEIAVRKGGPLLLGAGAYLRAMIDAADGRAPSIQKSVAHTRLGKDVGDATVKVTVVLSPDQRAALADELARGGQPGSPTGTVLAGALGLKLGPTVSLQAVLVCESAPACAQLADTLRAARDARVGDVGLRLVGFAAVLERLQIDPEGDLVRARTALPAEEAATLAERLLALRGFRHPMPKDAPSAQPASPPPPPPDEVIAPDAGARKDDGKGKKDDDKKGDDKKDDKGRKDDGKKDDGKGKKGDGSR
jgi:hypothetical protein